jgi:hypothetical protein
VALGRACGYGMASAIAAGEVHLPICSGIGIELSGCSCSVPLSRCELLTTKGSVGKTNSFQGMYELYLLFDRLL